MKLFTAFLDMDHCPVSYDAITWLVRAMFERDERQCDSLHVVIVPNSKTGFARPWGKHDEAATRWRMWHIVIPACQLAGATVTLAPTRDWCQFHYESINGLDALWWPNGKNHFMAPLVDAARAGKKIPKLRASAEARRFVRNYLDCRPFCTVTIREQSTDPERNSSPTACMAMQEVFEARGYQAVILNDSNFAARHCGLELAHAEVDIDIRLALYERAAMNIIGNNGPQELLKFSDAPYLGFNQGMGNMGADHWREYFHMELGEQLPWANENQRLCFVPDTFENMRSEFEKWEAR